MLRTFISPPDADESCSFWHPAKEENLAQHCSSKCYQGVFLVDGNQTATPKNPTSRTKPSVSDFRVACYLGEKITPVLPLFNEDKHDLFVQ